MNINFAYQTNFDDPVTGLGIDFGGTYTLLEHERLGNHLIGISTINLVAPSMSRSFISFGNPGEYSRDLKISWLGKSADGVYDGGLDISLRDIFAQAADFDSGKTLEWEGALRVGGWFFRSLSAHAQMGFGERAIEYLGIAAGIRMPLSEDGRSISSHYQYNIKTEGRLASTHTVYLVMNLGNRRDRRIQTAQTKDRSEEKKSGRDKLDGLRKIEGLTIEEEQEYVRITAREVAIHFASGSSELPPDALKVLKEIAGFLRSYPNHPVTIEGHTDSDPISGRLKIIYPDNVSLSRARAEKVREYFVKNEGIPQIMFTVGGYGETRPIAPNDTRENKYKNRRVVILISK